MQIGKKMKTDSHIRLRTIRYVAEADQYICIHNSVNQTDLETLHFFQEQYYF